MGLDRLSRRAAATIANSAREEKVMKKNQAAVLDSRAINPFSSNRPGQESR